MAIVTDGLVLYLHGACGKNNPATRVWKDLSGNGNDGELVNFGYTEDSGWVDGGLRFDEVDDYVQLPDLDLNPDNFTYQLDDKIISFRGDSQAIVKGGEIEYSGRNLLRNSNELVETDAYLMKSYYLTEDIEEGEIVTIFIKGETGQGKEQFGLYNSIGVGSAVLAYLYPQDRKTFAWKKYSTNSHIRLYQMPSSVSGVTSTIEWIKLEKGSTATPWTPAPEDITETNIINHTTPFVENNTIHTFRLYNRALTDEEIMQNYQADYEWTPQIGEREATTTMKPITTSLSRKGAGRREVTTTIRPITSSISKKLPPIHADIDIKERTPKLEVD